jgi:two-component system, chemotaxis family, protein-glutamate methylesterase/glutaminase
MSTQGIQVIVIGGSAGAIEALCTILPSLPADFSLPLVAVLHQHPQRLSVLTSVLAARCALRVKEAEDKEPLAPATLYLAPPDYHLLLERTRRCSLSMDAPVHFSRPSIDVLFESAADSIGSGLVGLLLTGANEDGARGLARIKANGGAVIVQSPASASVPTMPEAGLRLAAADQVLPLSEIGPFLAQLGSRASFAATEVR